VKPIEKAVHRVDRFQQRHVLPSFVFGVIKKFGDVTIPPVPWLL
jgi:hypothetical protein